MKMLYAVCVLLSVAGGVYTQTAGAACGASNNCDPGLVCQELTCRSKIEGACAVSNTDQCVLTAAPCPHGATCACPTGTNVNRDKTACTCGYGKVIRMDRTKCVAKLAEECAEAEDCVGSSECTDKKCACKADYIASAVKDVCLNKVMGDKKCACKADYIASAVKDVRE